MIQPKKKIEPSKSKFKFTSLPLGKRKDKMVKRVGFVKDIVQQHSKIDVTAPPIKKETVEIIPILDDIDYDDALSFETKIAEHDTVVVHETNSNDGTAIVNLNKTPRSTLTQIDLKDISENEMLNDDNVIHVFQRMMKEQYPDSNGLQDPVLGQKMHFNVFRNIPCVQVLHDGKLHWIAMSTYNCAPGEVFLMDSLFSGRIADHTKRQICSILHCGKEALKINVLPVQQQSNGTDYGVFALAFALHVITTNQNPIDVFFAPEKMRSHLLKCLSMGKMEKFPVSEKVHKRCAMKQISIEIFCSCRMPWRKADNNCYEKQMVECSGCEGWFHRVCERIPDAVFEKSKCNWYCYECSKNNVN